MRNLPLICCAALVAGIALDAAPALAARVVVLEVRGDDSSEFEEMLVETLKTQHDVVESRAFDRAARREGVADDLDDRAIARVARSLEAVAVLDTMLARRNGEWEFTIRVRGRDGKVKKKVKIELVAPRLGARGKKKVERALLEVVDEVLAADRGVAARAKGKDTGTARGKGKARDDEPRVRARGDDDDEPVRRRRDVDRDDDEDEDEPRRARRGGDDDDDDDEEDDVLDERPRRARPAGARELRRAGVVAEVGSSVIARKLSFSSRPNFDQAPRGYPGSPVPAAHLAVEVFPVAIALPKNPAAGLGFYAEYDRVMGLVTRTSQAMDVAMPTRQVRWVVGGKLRYSFGRAPTLPTIYAGLGYGRRAFIVDRSGLPAGTALDLPDVDYRIYEPSLGVRLPIGTERLALTLGGRGLLFKSAGAIQGPVEYGAAKITGAEGEAMIDAAITRKVGLRLRGSFTQIGYDFDGNGAQTNNRDGDPATADVGGAMDRWLSATAALAIVY